MTAQLTDEALIAATRERIIEMRAQGKSWSEICGVIPGLSKQRGSTILNQRYTEYLSVSYIAYRLRIPDHKPEWESPEPERAELAPAFNRRLQFRALVERHGIKSSYGYQKKTILLKDVVCTTDANIKTDHVWLTVGDNSEFRFAVPGDYVEFVARVKLYEKGFLGGVMDYKLSHPTKIVVCENE